MTDKSAKKLGTLPNATYKCSICNSIGDIIQIWYYHHDGTPKIFFCGVDSVTRRNGPKISVFYAAFPTRVCLMLNPTRFPKYGKYLHIYLFMTSGQVCGMWQRRQREDNSSLAKECSSSYSSKVLHNIIYVIYAPSLEAFKHSNIQNPSNVR